MSPPDKQEGRHRHHPATASRTLSRTPTTNFSNGNTGIPQPRKVTKPLAGIDVQVDIRGLSDRDLDDTITRLTPVVSSALAELPMLPEHVEEARTLLALCRIEQRRRRASNDATKVGWCG